MSSDSLRRACSREPHRGVVALLLFLAPLATLIASLTLWIDRQALDGEQWTQTSSRLIANREIRAAILSYAVDQLFARANVDGALRDVLPNARAGHDRRRPLCLGGGARRVRALIENWVTTGDSPSNHTPTQWRFS